MTNLLIVAFFILTLISMFSIDVVAEPIACLKGQICEISLENKIKASSTYAKLIISGSFKPLKDGIDLQRLSDDVSFMHVAFGIDKIYKGKIHVDIIKLKIPIYTIPSKAGPESSEDLDRKSIDSFSQDIQKLERKLEEGQIDRNIYKDELKNIRMQILYSSSYSEDKIVIVPIKRGGLDHSYRLIDVPIEMGKKYTLFIFRNIIEQSTTALFAWELDLYPDELYVIENVLQTIEK